jgi:hypothetical protein
VRRKIGNVIRSLRCAVTMPSASFMVIHFTDPMTGVALMTAKRSDGEASGQQAIK